MTATGALRPSPALRPILAVSGRSAFRARSRKQKFVQLIGWSQSPLRCERREIGEAKRKIGASSATLVAYLANNCPIAWDNLTCALHCPLLSTPVESPETANFFLWHVS